MVNNKPVVTCQTVNMLRHSNRIGTATPHKYWQWFFCLCVKRWTHTRCPAFQQYVFVLLFLVVLAGEVSRRLGGLYFNCDKVESLLFQLCNPAGCSVSYAQPWNMPCRPLTTKHDKHFPIQHQKAATSFTSSFSSIRAVVAVCLSFIIIIRMP